MQANGVGPAAVAAALERARQQIVGAEVLAAEAGLRALVADHAGCVDAWLLLAELAGQRDDHGRELECVRTAYALAPADQALGLDLAQLHLRAGDIGAGVRALCALLARAPANYPAWFVLGDALALAGRKEQAVRARSGWRRARLARHGTARARCASSCSWIAGIPT